MDQKLISFIQELNPWLNKPKKHIQSFADYLHRNQEDLLFNVEWDNIWTILVGPRQSGKTTLGKYICQKLILEKRFSSLLYLNCDILEIRDWLQSHSSLQEVINYFKLSRVILFIDEIQLLDNPGLLLRYIIDLQLPIKLIACSSTQLSIKSKVKEHLADRIFEVAVLPLNWSEIIKDKAGSTFIYGSYPHIIMQKEKDAIMLLNQLFHKYINKDICACFKISKLDVFEKLITRLAFYSGQLINYTQLANDCNISIQTVQHYINVLERTYIIQGLKPFVGNQRTEITANPIYYFIDNGIRNHALGNFADLNNRIDASLLVKSEVFQEILKFKLQNFHELTIHCWRTKSGAKVDFVLSMDSGKIIPVEINYTHARKGSVTRGFRSFIEAYKPKQAIYVTKEFKGVDRILDTDIHFIPCGELNLIPYLIDQALRDI